MNPFLKSLLILLAPLATLLHAETEKEFGERVAKAWNSKDASEILALYGNPETMDPDIKKSTTGLIDFQLKTGFTKVDVSLLPADSKDHKSFVMKGKIIYLKTEIAGRVKVDFVKTPGSMGGSMTTAFTKGSDKTFTLASPTVKAFAWTGEEMTSFNVRLKSEKADAFIPEVVIVAEKCGHIDWLTTPPSTSLAAHKIINIIVSPTPDSETLTLEISKGMEEPFFKKTINTSKGAIIPIEPATP